MTLLIIPDILGLLFGVLGAILVGNKDKRGFLAFILGSLSHGCLGYFQGNYGLMLTCSIFIVIDIYYYIKWRKEENESTN